MHVPWGACDTRIMKLLRTPLSTRKSVSIEFLNAGGLWDLLGDGISEIKMTLEDHKTSVSLLFGHQILFLHPLGWLPCGCSGIRAIGKFLPGMLK